MIRVWLIVVLQAVALFAFSQEDSVAYTREFKFSEGIYLDFRDFRSNKPLPEESIVSTRSPGEPDFYTHLFAKDEIVYKDSSGKEQTLSIKRIWGYCHDQSVYIGARDAARLPVIGSFTHFSRVEVYEGPTMYGIAGPIYSPPRQEINQYVLDMRTGQIVSFTAENFEALLEAYDADLHKEFSSLKKRHKREKRFLYLRRFNERHPLYFPS